MKTYNCAVEIREMIKTLVRSGLVPAGDALPAKWKRPREASQEEYEALFEKAVLAFSPSHLRDEENQEWREDHVAPWVTLTKVEVTLDGGGLWKGIVATEAQPDSPYRNHILLHASSTRAAALGDAGTLSLNLTSPEGDTWVPFVGPTWWPVARHHV